MPALELSIESTRGALVESVHRVSVAVVRADGRLVAAAGNPDQETWWRSAAKPFQAMPLVQDGAADRFGLTERELALVCGSHSSEPEHRAAVTALMARVGVTEDQLACGIHTPLSPAVARELVRGTARMTPLWSNCSGKHTGMLALARHHGWPLEGYNAAGHPVQERILEEICRWTGLEPAHVRQAVDGCTVVCFGLPVRAMALAYARLSRPDDLAARRIASAMMAHPFLVAGTGRLCTDLMTAWPGRVLAKVGADGVYGSVLPGLGLGIALKVEDGDTRSAGLALLEILRQVLARIAPDLAAELPWSAVAAHGPQVIRNTRDQPTGELRAAGALRFFDG